MARREDFAKVFEGVPRAYIDACRQAEDAARDAEARRLARQRTMQRRVGVLLAVVAVVTSLGGWLVVTGQRDFARQRSAVTAAYAKEAFEAGQYDRAMRLALVASQGTWFAPPSVDAEIQLGRATHFSRLEAQLTGHNSEVWSAAFSPDGKHIVTASSDDTARVWSRGEDGTWNSIALEGHQVQVKSAVFSPDGTRIVTTFSDDKTARVWSRGEDGACSSTALEGHQGMVTSADFSPDGARIVTASDDNTTRVWSLGEGDAWTSVVVEEHQDSASFSPNGAWTSIVLEKHEYRVNSASFSPGGTHIVTASNDDTARVWDVRWLMGPGDWAKAEPLSLPETVCREKLHGSWTTVKDPKTGRNVERIAERLLTADDIKAAPVLYGREGEDVCAPFLEKRPWWSRLAFWR